MINNHHLLVYTFRTNPFKDELRERFPGLFVFGKLKEDFEAFKKKIDKERPKLIVGCARSDRSCFETKTINRFNEGMILKGGRDCFGLCVPESRCFDPSLKPTSSFCNWTMYKISNLLFENKLNSKLSFIHFKGGDYPKLIKSMAELR